MKNKLTLIVMALTCIVALAQTNAPPADKVTLVLDRVQTWLSGILTLATVVAAWWAANRSKVASVVPVLIKAVETHGSDALRAQIKDAAGTAGVEPTLNKLVESHTSTFVKPLEKPTVIIDALKPDAK